MQVKSIYKKIVILFLLISTVFLGVYSVFSYSQQQTDIQFVAEAALTSSQVKTVQTKLKRWGYYTGVVDGVYGPKTKNAVISFQKKKGKILTES